MSSSSSSRELVVDDRRRFARARCGRPVRSRREPSLDPAGPGGIRYVTAHVSAQRCRSAAPRGNASSPGASAPLRVGEPALLLLREDQLTVREHVVLASAALLDLGLVLRLGVQLGRETRSPCVVAVSDGAVLNENAATSQTYRLTCAAGRRMIEAGEPQRRDRRLDVLRRRHRPSPAF